MAVPMAMGQTHVSSCVLSIVASFTSGLDVFGRVREARRQRGEEERKRKPRKKGQGQGHGQGHGRGGVDASASRDGDLETRLGRSLRRGPEEIGREYARSVGVAGEEFGRGDAIAQTSLAEILLRLNTGLVRIISTFLRKEEDVRLDYAELTRISDRCRVDTCSALRGLTRRLVQSTEMEEGKVGRRGGSPHGGRKKAKQKHTKVRGPMLARVVIADSAKASQLAMVRPGERSRQTRGQASKAQSSVCLTTPMPAPSPPDLVPDLPARPHPPPHPIRKQSAVDVSAIQAPPSHPPRPRREPSTYPTSSPDPRPTPKALRTTQSTPRLEAAMHELEMLPPLPNTAPLPAFEPRRRKHTPTYYSIETTSTKLGEIPLHKWAEPYDFDAMSRLNKEAELNGWPLSDMDQTHLKKKRRLGIFRLFRKKGGDA